MPSPNRFLQKIALITGAASGIGRAAAQVLAAEGAIILAADLNESADPNVQTIRLDVTSEADWQCLAEAHPQIDIYVASAGISHAAPLESMPLADWRRVLAVNLDGQFLGLRYALKALRPGGSAILVGSASGIKPAAGASAYCASKAALRMLMKTAALEAKPKGIRVNLIAPAGVVTPMWKTMDFFQTLVAEQGEAAAWKALGGADPATDPLARMAFPEEIANVIAWLASGESRNMTGAEIPVDAGYTAS